jgi:arginase family enzyme
VREQGVFDRIIDTTEFVTIGLQGALDIVHSLMKGQPCYLSIDLDVLDPLSFPCVGAPISGGLQPMHLFGLVKGLRSLLVAADIVEFLADQASPLHYLLITDLFGQLTTQS